MSIVSVHKQQYNYTDVWKALKEALNLLDGVSYFIKPGDRVFIKPNAVTDIGAERGVTTDPQIVGALTEIAFDAGASKVIVGESSVNWSNSYDIMKKLGITTMVKERGGMVIDLDQEPLVEVDIPRGEALRKAKLARILLEVDVIINAPKAKTHMIDGITCCIKNWVGLIPQKYRLQFHQMPRLIQVVIDIMRVVHPTLCVVDAIVVGEGEGPLNVDPRFMGAILVGDDPVATDVIVGQLLGISADELWFPWAAFLAGLGELDYRHIELRGISPELLQMRARRPIPAISGRFPCNVILGGACWGCLTWFIGTLVSWGKDGTWERITQLVGKPTFMLGFNANDPALEEHLATGPYLVIGDCTLATYEPKQRFPEILKVPGCPPGPAFINAVQQLLDKKAECRKKGEKYAKGENNNY
ncbi:MAG: DUF362 domain-containing protein [Candidatus Bathyarchaeia archaeon]